jgi:hypothetical protein
MSAPKPGVYVYVKPNNLGFETFDSEVEAINFRSFASEKLGGHGHTINQYEGQRISPQTQTGNLNSFFRDTHITQNVRIGPNNNLHFYFRRFFANQTMFDFYKQLLEMYPIPFTGTYPNITYQSLDDSLTMLKEQSITIAKTTDQQECHEVITAFITNITTRMNNTSNDSFNWNNNNTAITGLNDFAPYNYGTAGAATDILVNNGPYTAAIHDIKSWDMAKYSTLDDGAGTVAAVDDRIGGTGRLIKPTLLNKYGNPYANNSCIAMRILSGVFAMILHILMFKGDTVDTDDRLKQIIGVVAGGRGLVINTVVYDVNTGDFGGVGGVIQVGGKYNLFNLLNSEWNILKPFIIQLSKDARMTKHEYDNFRLPSAGNDDAININDLKSHLTTVGAGSGYRYTIPGLGYSYLTIRTFLDTIQKLPRANGRKITDSQIKEHPHFLNYIIDPGFKQWLKKTLEENRGPSLYERAVMDALTDQFKILVPDWSQTPIFYYSGNSLDHATTALTSHYANNSSYVRAVNDAGTPLTTDDSEKIQRRFGGSTRRRQKYAHNGTRKI